MPNDSVARLVELVPPPGGTRPALDWDSVEAQLGRTLPDDYKELAGVYGAGQFDRYVLVHVPDESRDYVDLLNAVQQGRERLEYFAAKGEILPYRPDELLQVATTDNGDSIYWAAPAGKKPNDWTIVVTGSRDFDEFPEYELGLVDFLVEVLSGRLRVEAFAPDFPDEAPVFVPEED